MVLDSDSLPTYDRYPACDVLYAASGGRRDALLFDCYGGGFRTTMDPREVRTPTGSKSRDDLSRGVICRYLIVEDLDAEAQPNCRRLGCGGASSCVLFIDVKFL